MGSGPVPDIGALAAELRRFAPFRHLAPDELFALAAHGEELEVEEGTILVRDGSPTGAVFLVIEGALAVFRDLVGHPVVLFERLAPGDLTGHIALYRSRRAPASIRALEASRVLRIGADELQRVLAKYPQASEELQDDALLRYGLYLTAEMAVERDRRRRTRLDHEVVLELADGSSQRVRLRNLSLGGLCLERAPFDWETDSLVLFGLRLGSGSLRFEGRVVWRRDDTLGIRFTRTAANHDMIVHLAIRVLIETPSGLGS